jgi:WD40 repeat protein
LCPYQIIELPRAKEASFSSGRSGAPSLCFTGTRKTILKTITDWLEDEAQPTLFWLNGLAGIGKSTIAKTIAKYANDHEVLGGSFFFSRGDKTLSDASLVFPTLAFQLAQSDPDFKKSLGKALEQNADYGYEAAPTQLDKLIITPLRESNTRRKILLFVVDALDECSSKDKAAELLHLLLAHSTRFPFVFRIFITSRPENHIRSVLNRESNIAKIVLHDIETSIVRNDIHAYLKEELSSLPRKLDVTVGLDWPKESDLNAIVEKSGRFFVYAATAIKFIGKDPPRNPQRHLDILLGIKQATNAQLLPYIDLDNLYLAVLHNAFPVDSEEEGVERFRWVVGCIVLMLDPLSMEALGRFTDTDPEDIDRTLYHLHSVIISPSSFQEAPHIYHPSFRDFLTERCSDSMFAIVRTHQERRLLLRCLELMMGKLTRDVAQIGDYWRTNNDFNDLQAVADSAMAPEVQYSCTHWASHLLFLEGEDTEISAKLDEFASVHLLHWFEAMSLLNLTPSAVSIMRNVHEWAVSITILLSKFQTYNCIHIQLRSSSNKHLTTLLYDGYRFILSYQVVIAEGALQVYRSALPFTPNETLLYQTYQSEMYDSFHVLHGIGSKWPPRLSTVHGGHADLRSVAYSPKGQYFATGFDNSYITVWDSVSCSSVMTFRHSESPSETLPVAFTPDGLRLVSANSGAGAVKMYLWDILSGASTLSFQGHTKGINSLSICKETSTLASGSTDTTVRIWDISSGSCKATLKRGESPVWAVIFLPDASDGSQKLLSGSGDNRIRLWDVKTRTLLRTFAGHTSAVRALSVSHDGLRFASGSDDCTIKVFSLSGDSDKAIATLKGHSEPVRSLAFSPTDPSRLISAGPEDSLMRVWDVDSQPSLVTTLRGKIAEIAFSQDGKTLISGKISQ